MIVFNVPWQRYALIFEIVKRCEGKSPKFEKNTLQKMMYLMQELFNIDCGYDDFFDIYAHSPFSYQLLQDINFLEHCGVIKFNPVLSIDDKQAATIIKKGSAFLDKEVKKAIEALIEEFGHFTTRDLELRAAIIFVEKDYRKEGKLPSKNEVIEIIKQIKPRFSRKEIEEKILSDV